MRFSQVETDADVKPSQVPMNATSVLVVGGAGYIGSHMVRALKAAGRRVAVLDNLSTGHRDFLEAGIPFYEGDLANPHDLDTVFSSMRVSAVMHFAASSLVGESMREPLKYYRNNTASCVALLEKMLEYGVRRMIFSSTAAVYGNPERMPISEEAGTRPVNPYGASKLMIERMIRDTADSGRFEWVTLRYFNAAGASDAGGIGERHEPETHLIPNLLAALDPGEDRTLDLYGTDYPTRDGTCVRDYIHVDDLCGAHLAALYHLEGGGEGGVFNLGTGHGYTVGEVIRHAEEMTGLTARVRPAPRRPGDPAVLVAARERAEKILGWKPRRGLDEILQSAWRWYESTKRDPVV